MGQFRGVAFAGGVFQVNMKLPELLNKYINQVVYII